MATASSQLPARRAGYIPSNQIITAAAASILHKIIISITFLIITLALTAMAPDRVPEKAVQDTAAAPLLKAKRIIYPATRLPALPLPHGGTQPVKSVLSVNHVMTFGEYVWEDVGVQSGPVLVRVDLERQLMSVFRDGHEIGTALVIYGTESHPTPHGALRVLGKVEHYRSHKYGVPMEYTLWLNSSGIAIHASEMGPRLATHGCIGVPTGFAHHLFGAIHVGDKVSILSAGKIA